MILVEVGLVVLVVRVILVQVDRVVLADQVVRVTLVQVDRVVLVDQVVLEILVQVDQEDRVILGQEDLVISAAL